MNWLARLVAGMTAAARPLAVLFVACLIAGCETPSVPPPEETAQEEDAEAAEPEEAAEPVEAEPAPVEPAEPPKLARPVPESLRTLGSVPVALLVPLSGPASDLGEAMLAAAQMALFEAGDEEIILLPKDTGGNAALAGRAAEEAVNEGARVVLGPLCGTSVRAVGPVARAAGINVVAFSNDRSVAGDGVYLMGFVPGEQVERVVTYSIAQGHRRFGALIPDNDYGALVADALQATVSEPEAELVSVTRFPPDGTDLSGPIGDLAADAGTFDAIMVAAGGAQLRAAAPLFPYFELDPAEVQLLGTGLWDDPAIVGTPALIGGWFAGPEPEARRRFERRFARHFGEPPPRLASLAYDATALVAALAKQAGDDELDRELLESQGGFAGLEGLFRFDEAGVAERGLAVLEVTASGFRVVDPAPARFEPALTQ